MRRLILCALAIAAAYRDETEGTAGATIKRALRTSAALPVIWEHSECSGIAETGGDAIRIVSVRSPWQSYTFGPAIWQR